MARVRQGPVMSSNSASSARPAPPPSYGNSNIGHYGGNDCDRGWDLHGTNFDNFIVGTNSDDTIVGRNGNDTLDGANGDDFIAGGNDIRMRSTSGICPSACSARSGGAPRRSLTPSASAAPS